MYIAGFRKESLSGSLLSSSMVHVEDMFYLGRRGGEIANSGSGLGCLLIRVGELTTSGGVGLVRIWIGVIVDDCTLPFFTVLVLLWLCKLWDVR